MEISSPLAPATASSPAIHYSLPPRPLPAEDILVCVDVDAESQVEMKSSGAKGRVTRLDAIKQAVLLFVNAKLAVSPDHRFSFSVLAQAFAAVTKDFTNDINVASRAVHALTGSNVTYGAPDLTSLFQVASREAIKSRSQGRLLRVVNLIVQTVEGLEYITLTGLTNPTSNQSTPKQGSLAALCYISTIKVLIYCRSSIRPQHQWPVSEKLFTLDVMYLHDKPNPINCPQAVYDSLVDALEHVSQYEGYIFEIGQGLVRTLFRQMCVFLCHPYQRCPQDDLDIPKSIAKPAPVPVQGANVEECVPRSSQ